MPSKNPYADHVGFYQSGILGCQRINLHSYYALFSLIAEHEDEKLSISELGRLLDKSPSNTGLMLKRLLNLEFVEKHKNCLKRYYSLTDSGREFYEGLQEAVNDPDYKPYDKVHSLRKRMLELPLRVNQES